MVSVSVVVLHNYRPPRGRGGRPRSASIGARKRGSPVQVLKIPPRFARSPAYQG